MPEQPQTLQVTLSFKVKHSPGSEQHLDMIVMNYFTAKGVHYQDGVIEI